MEKLVVSAQDLQMTPVFPGDGAVSRRGSVSVPIGARILFASLALVLPVLCVATIVVWLVMRHKAPQTRSGWIQMCCMMLVVSGLGSSLLGIGAFCLLLGDRPPPEQLTPPAVADEFSLNLLTSFPRLPSSTTLTPKELAAAVDSMIFIVARDAKWANPSRQNIVANGFGSGVLLFADEQEFLIATSRHVVDGAEWERSKPFRGGVVLGGHKGGFGHAQIAGRHKSLDLMLLRVPRHAGRGHFAQAIEGFEKIETGERIVTLGHPQGLFFTLADGLVSRTDGADIIQISAPVSPGSSGGPLFDLRGQLLGIVTAMWNKQQGVAENLNFALRADAFLRAEDWNFAPGARPVLAKFIAATRTLQSPPPEP
jgi:hypothetical protein